MSYFIKLVQQIILAYYHITRHSNIIHLNIINNWVNTNEYKQWHYQSDLKKLLSKIVKICIYRYCTSYSKLVTTCNPPGLCFSKDVIRHVIKHHFPVAGNVLLHFKCIKIILDTSAFHDPKSGNWTGWTITRFKTKFSICSQGTRQQM